MMLFWEILHHWDQIFTLAINGFHSEMSDFLMMFLSRKEMWFPLYALLIFFLFQRLGLKKGLIVLISVGLTIVACDQTSNLLKYAVGRLRPCYSKEMVMGGLHILEGRGSFFGFFSAHSANAFGLAMATIWGFRNDKQHQYGKFTVFIIVWAFFVAISRIFVGKHYFGDILVGALIGIFYGCLLGYLAKWVIQTFFKEKAMMKAL